MARITIDGATMDYLDGTTFEEIAGGYQKDYKYPIVLVKENGRVRELTKRVTKDAVVEFITLDMSMGHKAYERSATMLFVKALSDVVGDKVKARAKVEFKVHHGIYISNKSDYSVTGEFVAKVKAKMEEIVEANLPIFKKPYSLEETRAIFAKQGMTDKVNLFKYRHSSTVNLYCLDGYYDYFYGFMLPSTGYIKYFDLLQYKDGFMLVLPHARSPITNSEFVPKEKLFNGFETGTEWSDQMHISTVGDLNNEICAGNLEHLILVQEALQERKIAEIATEIAHRGGVKFVMIAGPSSSGKTSFSHRLSIQLRTLGLNPHPIACDDYFVDRDKTPRLPNGDFDFECIEAIDTEQFNKDMCDLLAGKEVKMPTFNFKTGMREYRGNTMKLDPDDILVIEGIHGLNDKMSYALPNDSKYKIFISALTTLNIDEHNRIPTTDGRLIRRMVRDFRTRGASGQRTIQMWPNVRKGEEENIFPYQESADVLFNSALIFELAALKQYAEPILYGIDESQPEYYEAQRLLNFLRYFLSIPSDSLPHNSIAREFVGGSCFNV